VVFDAALAAGARLVYASSIAALADGQLYRTWKRANEGTAAAFWAEDGFPSVGIRAALVYEWRPLEQGVRDTVERFRELAGV
jgi:nucleoside-diphosphate-sugar epimerase